MRKLILPPKFRYPLPKQTRPHSDLNVYQMALKHLDKESGQLSPFRVCRKGWRHGSFFTVVSVEPFGWWEQPSPYYLNPVVKGRFCNTSRLSVLSCPGSFGYEEIA